MTDTGRPLMYATADDMQNVIDKYFTDCEGVLLTDADGTPTLNKYDEPIYIGAKPPTITGLALALGFSCRQTLLNYQARDEFVDTVTRAKARVEAYAEARLFDRDGSNGAKFSLANNFKGWSEKQDLTLSNKDDQTFKISDGEADQALKALGYIKSDNA